MIISNEEVEIRIWVELRTIGRDYPDAPVDSNIRYLQILLDIIDKLRLKGNENFN